MERNVSDTDFRADTSLTAHSKDNAFAVKQYASHRSLHTFDVIHQLDALAAHSLSRVHIAGEHQELGVVVDQVRFGGRSIPTKRLEIRSDVSKVIVSVDLEFLV